MDEIISAATLSYGLTGFFSGVHWCHGWASPEYFSVISTTVSSSSFWVSPECELFRRIVCISPVLEHSNKREMMLRSILLSGLFSSFCQGWVGYWFLVFTYETSGQIVVLPAYGPMSLAR